jgi:hypothetical protein
MYVPRDYVCTIGQCPKFTGQLLIFLKDTWPWPACSVNGPSNHGDNIIGLHASEWHTCMPTCQLQIE